MTDRTTLGGQMHALVERLYPLCRSITGDGVRATLDVLAESIPLTVHEIPTGTAVLDWTVPKEWNIRDAYVADPEGRRVIDFTKSNLHVVGYSVPVRTRMSLAALREHLHTLPEQPDLVPYRTSYYKEAWGFCLSQNTLDSLPDTEYEVVIDSTLADGSLTYAEHVVSGQVSEEVLVSCHVCHPSLANDNLAAIAVAVELAKRLAQAQPYYTYRFLFAPGTIGAITFLAQNIDRVDKVKHGLVSGLCRRLGIVDLQAKQAWRCGDRPDRGPSPGVVRPPPHDRRLLPLRLRRAAVLLARVQHGRRLPDQDPVRGISGVPHLR